MEKLKTKIGIKIKIEAIKMKLILIRQKRRVGKALSFCSSTWIVLLLWLVFGIIVWPWGEYRKVYSSVFDFLWDIKFTFFSTVIVAIVIALITGINREKGIYTHQHKVYVSLMYYSSELLKELAFFVTNRKDRLYVPFWPLYTSDMISDYENFIKCQSGKGPNLYAPIKIQCLKFINSIDCFLIEINSGNIRFDNKELIEKMIRIKNLVDDVIKTTEKVDEPLHVMELELVEIQRIVKRVEVNAIDLSKELYSIIEMIRYPWRRDIKYKKEILELIGRKQGFDTMSYYDLAILNKVDYEYYAKNSEEMYFKNNPGKYGIC